MDPIAEHITGSTRLALDARQLHETTTADEAREKLAKGMAILIREGSVSKDLHQLIPLISRDASPFLAFCTDDRNPLDIGDRDPDACFHRGVRHALAGLREVTHIRHLSLPPCPRRPRPPGKAGDARQAD